MNLIQQLTAELQDQMLRVKELEGQNAALIQTIASIQCSFFETGTGLSLEQWKNERNALSAEVKRILASNVK